MADPNLTQGGDPTPAPSVSAAPAPALDAHGEAAAVFRELSGDTAATDATPPVTTSEPSPTPEAATSPDDDEVDAATLATGQMPLHRHKAVLTNTRKKTRAEVEAEYKPRLDKLSWAEQLNAQEAIEAIGLHKSLRQAAERGNEQALAFIATQLGLTYQPPAAATPEPEFPEPDLTLDDGRTFYTAPVMQAAIKAVVAREKAAWRKEIDEVYGPLKEKAQLVELKEHAETLTTTTLAHCRAHWPMFAELEKSIRTVLVNYPQAELQDAYFYVLKTEGLPKIQQSAEHDRASQLHRKAAASTALQPGAPRPVTPRSDADKTPHEIAREVMFGAPA